MKANTCAIERLESRQLLSAVLNAHDTLQVFGTDNADAIVVTVNADESVDVSVNGASPAAAPFTGVKKIKIHGLAGDDQITLNESSAATLIPATLRGGAGNDTLTAGDEDSYIAGGDGADVINAGNGNDVIHGGKGSDNITVGNGSDIVMARGADNTVVAGTGNDTIVGGNHTSITGGGGDDLLWGLHDNDTLTANVGGLTGSAIIYTSSSTTDTVNAGSTDTVNPNGRKRPLSYHTYLHYLESLRQVPIV